ncbi:MAG: hypothetical protein D6767_11125 [Candidatus Hydrogenedentota bacterium]|nr:MAG: hypothetical protein D6767_11125 [Candidatus Hydrogenedentota bacterium]
MNIYKKEWTGTSYCINNLMLHRYAFGLIVFFSLGFLACGGGIPYYQHGGFQEKDKVAWEKYYQSFPKLKPIPKDKAVSIRVLKLTDPRLPDLPKEKILELLTQARKFANVYLGYDVRFLYLGEDDLKDFFESHADYFKRPEFRYRIASAILHPEQPNDEKILRESIFNTLRKRKWNIVQKYLPEGKSASDYKEAAKIIADSFLQKYFSIAKAKVKDGTIFKSKEYAPTQDYLYWTSLQYELKEADLIITNSMIFSADDGMPPYVLKRGGITSAVTENNLFNPLQGTIVLGLHQFISTNPTIQKMRGDIPEKDLPSVIAMLLTHELGHLLLRLDEYYDLEHSVHVAPRGLNYYPWYLDIVQNSTGVLPPEKQRILEKF